MSLSPAQKLRIEKNRQAALLKQKKEAWKPSAKSTYIDYDISNKKDSKAGFLVDDIDQQAPIKKKRVVYDHDIFPVQLNEQLGDFACSDCHLNTNIDTRYRSHYGVLVCQDCITAHPNKYTLLTKTEVIQDYLITNEQLTSISVSSEKAQPNDGKMLRYWEKDNPRQSSYARMHLFMRQQVEDYVFKHVWKSEEVLDLAFDEREESKKKRAHQKRQASLKEMRKRVMTSVAKNVDLTAKNKSNHIHTFEGSSCTSCGLQVEEEEL